MPTHSVCVCVCVCVVTIFVSHHHHHHHHLPISIIVNCVIFTWQRQSLLPGISNVNTSVGNVAAAGALPWIISKRKRKKSTLVIYNHFRVRAFLVLLFWGLALFYDNYKANKTVWGFIFSSFYSLILFSFFVNYFSALNWNLNDTLIVMAVVKSHILSTLYFYFSHWYLAAAAVDHQKWLDTLRVYWKKNYFPLHLFI